MGCKKSSSYVQLEWLDYICINTMMDEYLVAILWVGYNEWISKECQWPDSGSVQEDCGRSKAEEWL